VFVGLADNADIPDDKKSSERENAKKYWACLEKVKKLRKWHIPIGKAFWSQTLDANRTMTLFFCLTITLIHSLLNTLFS
jgi:hypothetical protein